MFNEILKILNFKIIDKLSYYINSNNDYNICSNDITSTCFCGDNE